MTLVIALDGMGGDAAPGIVVEGAAMALREQADLRFLLFGDRDRIGPLLSTDAALAGRVELVCRARSCERARGRQGNELPVRRHHGGLDRPDVQG